MRGVIVLLLIGFVLGVLIHIERYVQNHARYKVASVEIKDRPSWCPKVLTQQLEATAQTFVGRGIYDRKLLGDVVAAYQASSWVRRVNYVRKRFPDSVVVSLDLRRPEYAVERAGKGVVVDRDGYVVLSQAREWSETVSPLLVIWGVRSTPPVPGRRWMDSALLGGIEVLHGIEKREGLVQRAGITGVDVSNFGGSKSKNASDIIVRARNNFQIAWGRPQSTPRHGEKPDDDKLDLLERYLRIYPQPKDVVLNARYAGDGGGAMTMNLDKTLR